MIDNSIHWIHRFRGEELVDSELNSYIVRKELSFSFQKYTIVVRFEYKLIVIYFKNMLLLRLWPKFLYEGKVV